MLVKLLKRLAVFSLCFFSVALKPTLPPLPCSAMSRIMMKSDSDRASMRASATVSHPLQDDFEPDPEDLPVDPEFASIKKGKDRPNSRRAIRLTNDVTTSLLISLFFFFPVVARFVCCICHHTSCMPSFLCMCIRTYSISLALILELYSLNPLCCGFALPPHFSKPLCFILHTLHTSFTFTC